MFRFINRLRSDKRGTSALEYGFICAMIVIGLISAMKGFASESSKMWDSINSKSAQAASH